MGFPGFITISKNELTAEFIEPVLCFFKNKA